MSNSAESLLVSTYQGGSQVVSDTANYDGRWKLLVVLADCEFTNVVDAKMTGTLAGITAKAGTVIGGSLTRVKLASGAVMLYE